MGTILDIARQAAVELSLEQFIDDAGTLFGTANQGDSSPNKMLRALTKTCREIAADYPWKALRVERVIASIPAELQPDAIPPDFLEYIPRTFVDLTRGFPMIGPLSQSEWALLKARPTGTAFLSWMEDAGGIRLYPVPQSGRVFSFRYRSNAIGWSRSRSSPAWSSGRPAEAPRWGNGPVTAERTRIMRFVADTNEPLWDDELVILGTISNYLKIDKTPDPVAENAYQLMLYNREKQDGGRRVIDFSGDNGTSDDMIEALKRSAVITRVAN